MELTMTPIVGERIRHLRNGKGLSMRGFAKELGVSYQSVWLYESGRTLPRSRIALRMAQILEVSLDDLLSGGAENAN